MACVTSAERGAVTSMPRHLALILRIAVAAVLVAAGALKLLAIASAGTVPLGLWTPGREVVAAIAGAELALGLLVACGCWLPAMRLVCLALFTGFALMSGAAVLAGQDHCGCFGAAAVHPVAVLALDVVIVIGSAMVRWTTEPAQVVLSRWSTVVALSIVMVSCSLAALSYLRRPSWQEALPIPIAEAPRMEGALASTEQPASGTPPGASPPGASPLSPDEIGKQFGTGDWIVVLYRSGCGACREDLPGLLAQARGSASGLIAGPRWAFINVDQQPGFDPVDVSNASGVVHLHVPGPQASVPWLLKISDGRVVTSGSHLDALDR